MVIKKNNLEKGNKNNKSKYYMKSNLKPSIKSKINIDESYLLSHNCNENNHSNLAYLSSIINLHINHQVILAEKTGFMIAVGALILTISLTIISQEYFKSLSLLLQLATIVSALGCALSIIMAVSVELVKPLKKVKSFHPLSLEEFNEEAKDKFKKDLIIVCDSKAKIIDDFSSQILEMKEEIYKKTKVISSGLYLLLIPLFIATLLICVYLYSYLF